MSLPRIVVDNSALLPAFFPESSSVHFDAGLVTNRSRALVHAIRTRRVNAFVPPSFYREFLNVAVMRTASTRNAGYLERVRAQWEDLLSLKLINVPLDKILYESGRLTFEELCPAVDAWYVAASVWANATFWMSHAHKNGLVDVAARFAPVRLLASEAPDY
jgi:hypothetical protein